MMYSRPSLISLSLLAMPCPLTFAQRVSERTGYAPAAIKIGDYDTWSYSLMSHKARCHSDAGPFSLAYCRSKRPTRSQNLGS